MERVQRWRTSLAIRWRHRAVADPDRWDLSVRFDELTAELGELDQTPDLETVPPDQPTE